MTMPAQFPPEIIVDELPTGVRYRLPRRQLGWYRCVSIAFFLFGLLLCSAPVIPTWRVILALRQQIPAEQGLAWLLVALPGWLLFSWGVKLLQVGLFILCGHSEIELRADSLQAIECAGPLRWIWTRSTVNLRRLFLSDRFDPLHLFSKVSINPGGAIGAITPEWKAEVDSSDRRPFWLAPGYPRSWLLALAEDLARRCLPSPEPSAGAQGARTPVVVENDPDLSDYEELSEQPVGSRIVAEQSPDGLMLTVPAPGPWRRSGVLWAGLFVCFVAVGIASNLLADEQASGHPPERTIVLTIVVGGAGIVLVLIGIDRALRRAVLAVAGDTFGVCQSGLFGTRRRQWPRQLVADVFVVHYPRDNDHWQLQIQPLHGAAFQLLAHRDVHELRWVATLLRRALRCPGHKLYPLPAGFIVYSPLFALGLRQQRE